MIVGLESPTHSPVQVAGRIAVQPVIPLTLGADVGRISELLHKVLSSFCVQFLEVVIMKTEFIVVCDEPAVLVQVFVKVRREMSPLESALKKGNPLLQHLLLNL